MTGPISSRLLDRLEGCILLGAVGDAFGYVIEFKTTAEIYDRYLGQLLVAQPPLWSDSANRHVVSDDTQMTLFTAEACAVALDRMPCDLTRIIPSEARMAYLDWYHTQTGTWREVPHKNLVSFPEMFAERAPGMTCLTALRDGGSGAVSRPINDSKGCGGVMRVAPIAFIPGLDDQQAWTIACEAAALTHGHVLGWASSGALVMILRAILTGKRISDAVESTIAFMRERGDCDVMPDVLERSLSFVGRTAASPEEIETLGGGWVGEECLAIAAAVAMMTVSVSRKLEIAANHSGDSDSTASVAGQILGTLYGRRALEDEPHLKDAFAALDVIDPLNTVIQRFGTAIQEASRPG